MNTKEERYIQRKRRVRAKVEGSSGRPRLSVFKSNRYIYAQIIDDIKRITLAASWGSDPSGVGSEIAKKAQKAKIKDVVFDKGAFKYHGRLKALADAARTGGLKF